MEAERLALEAGQLIDADPAEAAVLLRRATELDPHCGIAYNNLGVLHLAGRLSASGSDLFAAAESFQTASRLLPGRADPRVNLGLVMELAGRIDDAFAAYSAAVDSAPTHMGAVQALASLEIRHGRSSSDTRSRLEAIAVQGSSAEWRLWARDQLLRSGQR